MTSAPNTNTPPTDAPPITGPIVSDLELFEFAATFSVAPTDVVGDAEAE